MFAGKGGVGKTSVAAATGVKTARAGKKTLVMSLDVAHSLADVFDLDRGLIDQNRGKPIKIENNLWIQELDVQEEIESNWGDIHKYLSTLLKTTGLNEILAEELAILPGMEEVSLLLYINRYVRTRQFDAILLDCAPTGESLRFISIPTTLEWYIKKIFKLERTIAAYARPIAKRLYDVPLPGDDYFDAIESLFQRLQGVDKILVDPETTTVRLVTNPEKIVLKETQRAFMYFSLYKMSTDAIIMNRVLPESVKDAYFDDWRERQAEHIRQAENTFSPIPFFAVTLFRGEILGKEKLASLAEQIYGARDPLARFFEGEPYALVKADGKYQLKVRLPFIQKKDIEMNKIEDELIIRVGSFKRRFLLPRQVAASKSVRARLDGADLSVQFEP